MLSTVNLSCLEQRISCCKVRLLDSTYFQLVDFRVQSILESLGGIIVHSFEEVIEVGAIFKAAFDKHFFDGVLRILEHFTRFLESLRINKIHWRHTHFVFKDLPEIRLAHAGHTAQLVYGKRLVKVFLDEVDDVG